ncbi:MAG: response regulator [Ruegeria sp.]|uniref:response regulator n=1 Tax=Ruegeria sp. TaxID=1879320 RepID=UPI00349ED39A
MQTTVHPVTAGPVSNVLIVDDHPLYRDALASALELGFDACQIRKACTLKETFETLEDGFEPDLIMFDLKLPDVAGISGFQELRKRLPAARVLVISSLASAELVRSLLDSGAMGFLPKDASVQTLKFALNEIASGRRYVPQEYRQTAETPAPEQCEFRSTPELSTLTPQQTRILKLICAGKPNKQIAYELSLAEATVKAHITALLRRLGVRNRTQAVVLVDSVLARQAGSEPEARAFLKH